HLRHQGQEVAVHIKLGSEAQFTKRSDLLRLKMHVSLLLRGILLLSLAVLSLDAARSEKKSRRKGNQTRGHKIKRNLLCLTPDPTLNLQIIESPSPERSLSPWTYKTSSDNSRIPSNIPEAQCKTKGCLTANGEEDLSLESKPIYYQINVLRKIKSKNARHYSLKLETKLVSVGCTCVSPTVVPQH
ncbi:hypothetical protein DNTS_014889, partial [Danionella cerebrum]